MTSGRRLRLIRIAAGLRQADVARAASLSPQRIAQLEREPWLPQATADRITEAIARAAEISQ